MRYLIWGTGPYCCEKINSFIDEEIVAFIERERTEFRTHLTILPNEIFKYEFDYIVVLSSHYMDIIYEIIEMGIDCTKIIPGITIRPYLMSELEYIRADANVVVSPDGSLKYELTDGKCIELRKMEDWKRVKKILCNEENADIICKLGREPVGKLYGSDRGGSICRYYIDEFMQNHSDVIHGKVLEIGDRTYSQKYGANVDVSHVLHFEKEYINLENDFYGDLRNGEGIKSNYYDCIILTQVLNFVDMIEDLPAIIINALKIGGVVLISVSGISQICRYDMDKYGQFWSFTDLSIRNMFQNEHTRCEIYTRGNCKVACAFLQGMSFQELSDEDLKYCDEDFQVFIFSVVTKLS